MLSDIVAHAKQVAPLVPDGAIDVEALPPKNRVGVSGESVPSWLPKTAEAETAWREFATSLCDATRRPVRENGWREALSGPTGRAILMWALQAADQTDLMLAPMFGLADANGDHSLLVQKAALARLSSGPTIDALSSLPYTGSSEWLSAPQSGRLRARLELLIWDAGSAARSIPGVGTWLEGNDSASSEILLEGGRGDLRQRSTAAWLLAIAASGIHWHAVDLATVTRLERLITGAVRHPEPLVWIPGAIAMARCHAVSPYLGWTLQGWWQSSNPGEHRRALTVIAATPLGVADWADAALETVLGATDPGADPWLLAALGPSLPASGRHRVWEFVSEHIARARPEVLWSLTRGLLAAARRGASSRLDGVVESLLRAARDRALGARTASLTDAQLWYAIERDTRILDGATAKPEDIETIMEASITAALNGGTETFRRMLSVVPTLPEVVQRAALDANASSEIDQRGRALEILESCGRAAALRLWRPGLVVADCAPGCVADAERAHLPALRTVAERWLSSASLSFPLHRTALRLLAYTADATGAPRSDEDSSARGLAAAHILRTVASAPFSQDPEANSARQMKKPLADALWRVLDAIRRVAAPSARSDEELPSSLGAWWAFASGQTGMLTYLQRSDFSAKSENLVGVQTRIDALRKIFFESVHPLARNRDGIRELQGGLITTGVGETALAHAIIRLAATVQELSAWTAHGAEESIHARLVALGDAVLLARHVVANPELALSSPTSLRRDHMPEEIIAQTTRLITTKDGDLADILARWVDDLGPVLSPPVESAIRRAWQSTRRASEAPDSSASSRYVGPYRLLRAISRTMMSEVWLADNAAERLFALKLPLRSVAKRTKTEIDSLRQALERETAILRDIYHPNVASLIDHGWQDGVPYLVLQFLLGTDLAHYAEGRRLKLGECKLIVRDVCAGLRALHEQGDIHCDMKPGNVFLPLSIPRPTPPAYAFTFDPRIHCDAPRFPLRGAIVLDYGIARSLLGSDHAANNRSVGSPGFMSPEQAQGKHGIDARSDIYSLAATVYTALSQRRFFDEAAAIPEYLFLHASTPPLGDPNRVRSLPSSVTRLLRAATDLKPSNRPDVSEFEAAFLRCEPD